MAVGSRRKQVNLRLDRSMYRTLETIGRQERRTVPQMARVLLEEALSHRAGGVRWGDDAPGGQIAQLAEAGRAFDWLVAEPDLYDDTCGQPM